MTWFRQAAGGGGADASWAPTAFSAQTVPAKNPLEGNADAIRAGMGLFRGRCADCHGMDARGVRGPDITQVWAIGPHRRRPVQDDQGRRARHRDAGQPAPVRPRDVADPGLPADAGGPAPHRPAARQRRERREDLPRQCARAATASTAPADGSGPDLSRVGAARSREMLALRIRGGVEGFLPGYEPVTLTPAERPADRRREEERGSVLGPDHGHAASGSRATRRTRCKRCRTARGRRCRPSALDRLSERRARRSAPLSADAARLRSRGPPVGDLMRADVSPRRVRCSRLLALARAPCCSRRSRRRRRSSRRRRFSTGLPADGSRWLTFGGNYTNQRHSPLTQITPANVNRLVPQWTFQTGTLGNFETTSLLRDNVLYVTGPQNVAWALDARTGRQIWRYRRELPREPHRLLRARQPRLRDARRQALHGHARRAPAGARHADRRHRLGRDAGGLQERLRVDDRADRRQGQGHRRRRRRRVRHSRLHRRLRRADRQARVALLHDSRAGRAGQRHVGGRFVEDRRRQRLGHRRLRPRAEPAVLRHRQSRAPTITARAGWATTCTATRSWRSTPTPASCAGTTSSRRTTCTTGTRPRCRSSPTSRSAASRARS